ncbi:pirin family protein [uncultured Dietzia sp.]|uniref:pirin family protein n=2 Tax=Dietzia TaxID=37914 RepID=UPI002629BCA9|nr:pirin family protein [uncultured Dietzia sp.]HMT50517.1 pirin family protein [Dietzia sp.]
MSAIRQVVPLGAQWPGVDPFLFAVHHLDRFPAADGRTMRPAASLAGRSIGQDFSGKDGWSMYHGDTVPGFPQHPHRGFETVTVVLDGVVDHADSLGAAARFGHGDTQWLTAGSGISHSEMFPLLDSEGPNTMELFQIWLNLAPEDKSAEPHFDMFWGEETPVVVRGEEGSEARFRLIAGEVDGVRALDPPPHSWAARPENHLAIWIVTLDPGVSTELPGGDPSVNRVLYNYGGALTVGEQELGYDAAVLAPEAATVTAGADGAAFLILQARPIGAPVVQQGPFVGNTREDIATAMQEYRAGVFGTWDLPQNDPVHDHGQTRFARYPDGTVKRPVSAG